MSKGRFSPRSPRSGSRVAQGAHRSVARLCVAAVAALSATGLTPAMAGAAGVETADAHCATRARGGAYSDPRCTEIANPPAPRAPLNATAARGAAPPPSTYVLEEIVDLGTLGGDDSFGGGLDRNGNVVGGSLRADGSSHAFRYAQGSMTDLGTVRPAPANSRARAVSPDGDTVVGWSESVPPIADNPGVHQTYHPARWTTAAGMAPEDLGTFPGYGANGYGCTGYEDLLNITKVGYAAAVNDAGVVVGVVDDESRGCPAPGSPPNRMDPWGRAFQWTGSGPLKDLGTFDDAFGGTPFAEHAYSAANAIDAAGNIVGIASRSAWGGWGTIDGAASGNNWLTGHAFFLPAGHGKGAMVDLGQPAGGTGEQNYSEATAINASGEIVVDARSQTRVHHTYRYKGGTFTDVGSLGGGTSGYGINDRGDIVGVSYTAAGAPHAIVVHDGQLIDLNELLPAGSPWYLLRARGINAAGDISGTGLIGGHEHAFLLKFAAPGVDIVTGPSGTTASRSATFEFSHAGQDTPFECQLDSAAFAPCTSPQTYNGLTDGAHRFRVRSHPAGKAPGAASQREWTVRTQAPAVLIDSAPSGAGNPPDATIAFHGSAPLLTFTCRLDAYPPFVCGSPQRMLGLEEGAHVFSVIATDVLGNSSTPTVVTWSVSANVTPSLPPPTTSCAAPSSPTASSGSLFAVGRSGTCLTRATVAGKAVWKAAGVVTLNGITITPAPGTLVLLSASGASGVFETTGHSTVQLGSLPPIGQPKFRWAEDAAALLTAGPTIHGLTKSVGGLDVLPVWPAVKLTAGNGGTTEITLKLSLPDAFTAIPGSKNEVSADLVVTASNDAGVSFGGKIRVGSLWLGPLRVKDLELGYDGVTETFEGALGLQLGAAGVAAGPELRVGLTVGPPPTPALLGCCLRKASLVVQGINKPIPNTPLFLQKIGGEASREVGSVGGRQQSYLKVSGTVGMSIGPELPKLGTGVVNFEGTGALSLSDPWMFELSGQASLLQFPLAAAEATYTYGVGATLKGNIQMTIAGYGLSAAIRNSFFQGRTQFSLEASGDINLPLLGSQHAEAMFSDKGFAACSEVHGPFGTYSLGWGVRADGTQVVLADVCDLGQLRAVASAAPATAAGVPRTLTLSGGSGPRLIAIGGRDRAPDITLAGPAGLRLASDPATRSARTAAGLVVADDAHKTTFVMLSRAPAGSYTLTSAADTITTVSTAAALPPAAPRVATRALAGGKRRLTYSQTPVPGQQLELYEQGPRGAGRLLVRTSRRSGRLTFVPTAGAGRKRRILAVTVMHGLARDRRQLAPYSVSDGPPGAVGRLARHGKRLTWRRAPRATQYAVSFAGAGGAATSAVTRRRAVAIPAGSVKVTIVALDTIGRHGRPASLKLGRSPR